jgi:hypothetical protein
VPVESRIERAQDVNRRSMSRDFVSIVACAHEERCENSFRKYTLVDRIRQECDRTTYGVLRRIVFDRDRSRSGRREQSDAPNRIIRGARARSGLHRLATAEIQAASQHQKPQSGLTGARSFSTVKL